MNQHTRFFLKEIFIERSLKRRNLYKKKEWENFKQKKKDNFNTNLHLKLNIWTIFYLGKKCNTSEDIQSIFNIFYIFFQNSVWSTSNEIE